MRLNESFYFRKREENFFSILPLPNWQAAPDNFLTDLSWQDGDQPPEAKGQAEMVSRAAHVPRA